METSNKQKNTVEGTDIQAQGNVNIGDKKVINVYGFETNQEEIKMFARIFAILAVLFPIGAVVFLMIPNRAQEWPVDFVASLFCGAFFALCLLFVIFLLRNKKQNAINVK